METESIDLKEFLISLAKESRH